MQVPHWLKRWLGWEAMMFQQIERKVDMNTVAVSALAAAMAAMATGVADIAAAIANHPAAQADDSGEIVQAAEKLQGFAAQLEELAGTVNADAGAGAVPGAANADAGTGAAAGTDTATETGADTVAAAAEPVGEAGTLDGHAVEPGPEVVEPPVETEQTPTS